MIRILLFLTIFTPPVAAETIVAARTIPAQTVLVETDLSLANLDATGGSSDHLLFIGMETRVALYAGRPIRVGDVGAPAIIERNQLISLIFDSGGLSIRTEGRALARAGVGEVISVMNLSSRTTVNARIAVDGAAYVGATR